MPDIRIEAQGFLEAAAAARVGIADYQRALFPLMREAVKRGDDIVTSKLIVSGLHFPGPRPRKDWKGGEKKTLLHANRILGKARKGSSQRDVTGSIAVNPYNFYLGFHERGYNLKARMGEWFTSKRSGKRRRRLVHTSHVPMRPFFRPAQDQVGDVAEQLLGGAFDVFIGSRAGAARFTKANGGTFGAAAYLRATGRAA